MYHAYIRKLIVRTSSSIEDNEKGAWTNLLAKASLLSSTTFCLQKPDTKFLASLLDALRQDKSKTLSQITIEIISDSENPGQGEEEQQERETSVTTLRGNDSLRKVEIATDFVSRSIISKALKGHKNVEAVTLRGLSQNDQLEETMAFLESLPRLKSVDSQGVYWESFVSTSDALVSGFMDRLVCLELGSVKDGASQEFVAALRRAHNLRELRLPKTSFRISQNTVIFGNALALLPGLESPHIGATRVNVLMQCRKLKKLTCSRKKSLDGISTIIAGHQTLESMNFCNARSPGMKPLVSFSFWKVVKVPSDTSP